MRWADQILKSLFSKYKAQATISAASLRVSIPLALEILTEVIYYVDTMAGYKPILRGSNDILALRLVNLLNTCYKELIQ